MNSFIYFLAIIRSSRSAENVYLHWVAIVMPSRQSELLPNLWGKWRNAVVRIKKEIQQRHKVELGKVVEGVTRDTGSNKRPET